MTKHGFYIIISHNHTEYALSFVIILMNPPTERGMCMMTKSEKQIMDLLWSVDKPLSCTEIIQMSGDKTWKDSYVHSLIKSLMKKDLVEVVSFELVSRSYARKFVPKLTKESYCIREYLNENPDNSFLKLFTAYLDQCDSADEVRALEDAIDQWKTDHS